MAPEQMCFDTERIRHEVDRYKTGPTAEARRRLEKAFEAFDERVRSLELGLQNQTGTERTLAERRIAQLKAQRGLHWERAQTAVVDTMPVARAEPVGERVSKAERVDRSTQPRKTERTRNRASQRTVQTPEPMRGPNFFQRLFRQR